MTVRYAVMTVMHGYLSPQRMLTFATEEQAVDYITDQPHNSLVRYRYVEKIYLTDEDEQDHPRSGAI